MDTIRLSKKGRGVIPGAMRTRHGWESGTELIIEDQGDALVLRAAKPFATTRVEDGLGCAGYRGPAKSPEEMGAGIDACLRRGWVAEDEA